MLCLLVAAPAALAHDPNPRGSGYVSSVSALEPNVVGVSVAANETNALRPSNYSGKEIVVRGDRNEPLLRFAGTSVYDKVARGLSYVWRDHRVVWTKDELPQAVQDDPTQAHLVFRWEIPATAAGTPFTIKGLLGWGPAAARVRRHELDADRGSGGRRRRARRRRGGIRGPPPETAGPDAYVATETERESGRALPRCSCSSRARSAEPGRTG